MPILTGANVCGSHPCSFIDGTQKKAPHHAAGQAAIHRFSTYELLESCRSWSACFFPFLASVLAFTVGLSVWIALPRLIVVVPDFDVAGAVHVAPAVAFPVIASFRQSKLMPRFLLTCAAATHWPKFLNP